MSTGGDTNEASTVYCYECGAEIKETAEICHECGVRQKTATPTQPAAGTGQQPADNQNQESTDSTSLTDEYSILQWLASLIVAALTFPLGVIVPIYLFYKASNETGHQQTALESWTAIIFGIIGIITVEIGGRTGAKILWGLFLILLIAAALVLGSL